MAYSLGDPYGPLRYVMRINGLVVGVLLGILLLVSSRTLLASMGLYTEGATLPLRIAGVGLLGAGLFLLLGANMRDIDMPQLLPCSVFHGLLALVLIVAYFRQELAGLNLAGQIALIIIFILCLIGTLAPLRYMRAEYRF